MSIIQFIQRLSFLLLIVCGSGESWANLTGVAVSVMILCLTSYKIYRHERPTNE